MNTAAPTAVPPSPTVALYPTPELARPASAQGHRIPVPGDGVDGTTGGSGSAGVGGSPSTSVYPAEVLGTDACTSKVGG